MDWRRSALLASATAGIVGIAMALSGCGSGGSEAVVNVNGESIRREELHSFLEATYGSDILHQLIDYELVMQNLKAKGLQVTDEEVEASLEERRQNSPQEASEIHQIMQLKGPRLEALRRRIRFELAVSKLLTQDIKVTEAQLKSWFEKNRELYAQPARVKFGLLVSSSKVRAETMARQLKNKSKTFAQLAEEQRRANDPAARNGSQAETPQYTPVGIWPPEVRSRLLKTKPGEITPVIPLKNQAAPGATETLYVIFRLVDRQNAKPASFVELRPRLEMDYKLEQVARQLVAPRPFEATIQEIESGMAAQRLARPGYREVLNPIIQRAAERLILSLRNTANVQVNDPMYARVANDYRTVPGAESTATPGNAATSPTIGNTATGVPQASNTTNTTSNAAPSPAPKVP